jgi:hypothetical protein
VTQDPRRTQDRAVAAARTPVAGDVDFTMMYAAHDAFTRDLDRLLQACAAGSGWQAADHIRWHTFTTQLHIHHRAEDDALWPPLRATALSADEIATLDAMEMEHAQIDPQLERVEQDVAAGEPAALAAGLRRLRDGLAGHMRHEENAALPMIARRLGPEGWAAFTATFRDTQGIRGAATYFPWLLDGAPADVTTRVLSVLPPPARLLYRVLWAPRYRRSHR